MFDGLGWSDVLKLSFVILPKCLSMRTFSVSSGLVVSVFPSSSLYSVSSLTGVVLSVLRILYVLVISDVFSASWQKLFHPSVLVFVISFLYSFKLSYYFFQSAVDLERRAFVSLRWLAIFASVSSFVIQGGFRRLLIVYVYEQDSSDACIINRWKFQLLYLVVVSSLMSMLIILLRGYDDFTLSLYFSQSVFRIVKITTVKDTK